MMLSPCGGKSAVLVLFFPVMTREALPDYWMAKALAKRPRFSHCELVEAYLTEEWRGLVGSLRVRQGPDSER